MIGIAYSLLFGVLNGSMLVPMKFVPEKDKGIAFVFNGNRHNDRHSNHGDNLLFHSLHKNKTNSEISHKNHFFTCFYGRFFLEYWKLFWDLCYDVFRVSCWFSSYTSCLTCSWNLGNAPF